MRIYTVVLAAAAICTGCGGGSGVDPGASARYSAEHDAHVAWLKGHPLPALPAKAAWPKDDKDCVETLEDAEPRMMRLPAAVMTAAVETNSRPWTFVKGDVNAAGTMANLRIVSSSGWKAFDDAAIETVQGWRFKVPSGRTGFKGCISQVSIT